MKHLLLAIVTLALCSTMSFATYDYNITTEYYYGSLVLNDQSVLVAGVGVKEIIANGSSHVEVQNTLPYEYGEPAGIQRIKLYNTSTANLAGGEVDVMYTYNTSSLNVTGGSITDSIISDSSTLNISGGYVSGLFVEDTVKVDHSAGHIRIMLIKNSATAIFSGGIIEKISSSQDVFVGNDVIKHIEIICKDHNFNTSTNLLTGTWLDDSTFSINLVNQAGYDDVIDNIFFTPEPASLALLALGGLMLRKRKN